MAFRTKSGLIMTGLLFLALACSQPATNDTGTGDGPATTAEGPSADSTPPAAVPRGPDTPTPPEGAEASERSALYTPTKRPPKVDTTISSVPLEEVLFDTFRGGFIPLPQADEFTIEALRDVIKPIYEPVYEPVEGGDWLRDDDVVIGYVSDSRAYAYPIKMLNLHEIVNDIIDGVPVLVSYCPLCASAVVYSRELDGQVLVFGNTSALHKLDMVMYDHETGSYWYQVVGEAIVGPLTGKRLPVLPSVTITWAEWKKRHPDTQILSRNLGLLGGTNGAVYDRDPFLGQGERYNQSGRELPGGDQRLYGRLRPGDMVFTIQVGESNKAYALAADGDQVINDQVGGEHIVVITRSAGATAVAYYSGADGPVLDFKLSDGSLEDIGTGSEWNDSGLAVSGPLTGARLDAVPSRTSFWFAVVAGLPGIELYTP